MEKLSLLPLLLLGLSAPTFASAQVLDVNQPSVNAVMASFSSVDLAQSFKPTVNTCAGAGVSFSAGWGSGGTFTAELWTDLPNVTGAILLASGSVNATPGTWGDVFWLGVPVTPGTTYYMVYSCTDTNMAIDGDTTNPYPDGNVFANSGFISFPGFDYTFRTWTMSASGMILSTSGTCPGVMTITVNGAVMNGSVAFAYGVAGSFTIPSGNCIGTVIDITNPTLIGFFNADSFGNITLSPTVPSALCGMTLQAVDMTFCMVSNPVIL